MLKIWFDFYVCIWCVWMGMSGCIILVHPLGSIDGLNPDSPIIILYDSQPCLQLNQLGYFNLEAHYLVLSLIKDTSTMLVAAVWLTMILIALALINTAFPWIIRQFWPSWGNSLPCRLACVVSSCWYACFKCQERRRFPVYRHGWHIMYDLGDS